MAAMPLRPLLVALLMLVACAAKPPPAPPRPPAPELAQIDVYGSRILDRERVLARWGDALVELLRAPPDDERVYDVIEAEIRAAGDFAFVHVGVTSYSDGGRFLSIDLVDTADRERRMRFRVPPTGQLPDPDGLVALWLQYEAKYHELSNRNAIDFTTGCRFWHCLAPFGHPALVPYAEAFATRVPTAEQALARVLRDDARDEHRAAAAFLLAHLASGERVVELMVPAIDDPSTHVRNNAMRVLSVMAHEHPEVAIPLDPVLVALNYPTSLDRNKASAILAGLAKQPAYHEPIRLRAGEILVDMLALRQPNNHDWAYRILKEISGRDLGEHDVAAWRAWIRAPR